MVRESEQGKRGRLGIVRGTIADAAPTREGLEELLEFCRSLPRLGDGSMWVRDMANRLSASHRERPGHRRRFERSCYPPVAATSNDDVRTEE
jgi:hypothetical protein